MTELYTQYLQSLIHMGFYCSQGNTKYVGNFFILHIVEITHLKDFPALVWQVVYGRQNFFLHLQIFHSCHHVRILIIIISYFLSKEFFFFRRITIHYRFMLQKVDGSSINRPI